MSNRIRVTSVVAILWAAAAAWGQDPRGRILGLVTDQSGSVIPKASVRATNTSTGLVLSTSTNDSGYYTLPYLIPGTYTLVVEMAGFKQAVRRNLDVAVDASMEVNIQLQIGEASESVQVTSDAPLLSTAEASLGQVVDQRRLAELPTYGGSVMSMVMLSPGVINATNLRVVDRSANDANSDFSTNGAGEYNNEFTIDGVSNSVANNRGGNTARVGFVPPEAAVGEFKMQTSSFDASVGHTMGSVVNVSIKSGTNQLQGQMYWIARNRVFDAPDLFQNRSGQQVPPYKYNRYGLAGGAPMYIPRVYNGRNRTFWFYTWEANKYGNPQTFISSVPTASERRGDLSALLALGADYQVYDPLTTVTTAQGQWRREPFAGNLIPASRLDPVNQKLLKFWPLPNQSGTADGRNNWFYSEPTKADVWSHLARLDHAFTQNHRAFVRLHADSWTSEAGRTFNNDANGFVQNRSNRGLALDDVVILGPAFLVNFRYGLTYQSFVLDRLSNGTDYAALGFSPALIAALPDSRRAPLPRVTVTPWGSLSTSASPDGTGTSTIHALNVNFTRTAEAHNIRFGADVRDYRRCLYQNPLERSPQFTYSGAYARGPVNSSANPRLGGEIASFLMGYPGGQIVRTASSAEQDSYLGLYVQDDFKVTRRLTLNLGLRYEYESPITERFDRSVAQFAFGVSNPIEAQARANYAASSMPDLPLAQFHVLGGLTFVNVGGNPRGYWKAAKVNFMPRAGLAMQINTRTVLRAGYGTFLASINSSTNNPLQYGFSQATPVRGSLDEQGLTLPATPANPFPGGLLEPEGASGGLRTYLGQSYSVYRDERLHPYSQRWTASVQRLLPAQFLTEAAYVGNRGTRLEVSRDLNTLPSRYLSRLPYRDSTTISYLAQSFPNPFRGTDSVFTATIARSSLLRPYPEFGSVTVRDPVGYSWYHSLQLRAERRMWRGFTIQAGYTWSKTMDATVFLNASDGLPYRSISSLDRTHRLVASGVWELPFGRGLALGRGMPVWLNTFAGGWQLNCVMQRQSGPPLGFGDVFTLFTGNPDDIVLPKSRRSVDRWFNTAAGFNRVSSQQLAQNIRVSALRFSGVRGDGQARYDFSAIKAFHLKERLKLQFRAECINTWNHPNLAAPNTTVTSTTFGTITSQDPPRTFQFSLRLVL